MFRLEIENDTMKIDGSLFIKMPSFAFEMMVGLG